MAFAALFAVFSVSLAAEGPALKAPTPTPVKPAQPAATPVTIVPTQPAAKTPATPITPVIGKKPGTGPAGRIGVTKALVSTLRVNNNARGRSRSDSVVRSRFPGIYPARRTPPAFTCWCIHPRSKT